LAANAGMGKCPDPVPGFPTMTCSGAEIFFLGVFLFLLVWSIVHSLLFYPVLYKKMVKDFQENATSKEIRGKVIEVERAAEGEYRLTVRYKRHGGRYQIEYEVDQKIDLGARIPLRILKLHPASAMPADRVGLGHWSPEYMLYICPLWTFLLLGGLPALLFYINYPWQCLVYITAFSIAAAAILSRRRVADVTNQIHTNATPILVEEFHYVAEDDDSLQKPDNKEDLSTVEPSLGSGFTPHDLVEINARIVK
jgi:membrane protein implicated in regulation of membrane protease activity